MDTASSQHNRKPATQAQPLFQARSPSSVYPEPSFNRGDSKETPGFLKVMARIPKKKLPNQHALANKPKEKLMNHPIVCTMA